VGSGGPPGTHDSADFGPARPTRCRGILTPSRCRNNVRVERRRRLLSRAPKLRSVRLDFARMVYGLVTVGRLPAASRGESFEFPKQSWRRRPDLNPRWRFCRPRRKSRHDPVCLVESQPGDMLPRRLTGFSFPAPATSLSWHLGANRGRRSIPSLGCCSDARSP
jgi:hypothetical protein